MPYPDCLSAFILIEAKQAAMHKSIPERAAAIIAVIIIIAVRGNALRLAQFNEQDRKKRRQS